MDCCAFKKQQITCTRCGSKNHNSLMHLDATAGAPMPPSAGVPIRAGGGPDVGPRSSDWQLVAGGEGDFNIILKSLDQLKLPAKVMLKVYGIVEKITDLFNIMHAKWSASRCFHQQHLKDCKNPNGTEFIMTTALAAPLAYNSND